jgi:hypothetical protein
MMTDSNRNPTIEDLKVLFEEVHVLCGVLGDDLASRIVSPTMSCASY